MKITVERQCCYSCINNGLRQGMPILCLKLAHMCMNKPTVCNGEYCSPSHSDLESNNKQLDFNKCESGCAFYKYSRKVHIISLKVLRRVYFPGYCTRTKARIKKDGCAIACKNLTPPLKEDNIAPDWCNRCDFWKDAPELKTKE